MSFLSSRKYYFARLKVYGNIFARVKYGEFYFVSAGESASCRRSKASDGYKLLPLLVIFKIRFGIENAFSAPTILS